VLQCARVSSGSLVLGLLGALLRSDSSESSLSGPGARQPVTAAEESCRTLTCISPGRGRHELNDLLDEQLEFLRTSAQAFDHGVFPEYKRIALVLRVLLHDTSQSHSLLEQLGGKASLRFLDTRHPPIAATDHQIVGPHDWPTGMIMMTATLSAAPDPHGEGSWGYVPLLGSDPERSQSRKPFDAWWHDSIIDLRSGETFSRRHFVLGIANREAEHMSTRTRRRHGCCCVIGPGTMPEEWSTRGGK
jgi:hypothetical protein